MTDPFLLTHGSIFHAATLPILPNISFGQGNRKRFRIFSIMS